MKKITLDRWLDGKQFAVTFSYDDGRNHDIRLVELLNKYGFKGTFCLNSSRVGATDCVSEAELKTVYRGHEVAVHTVTHPTLTAVPDPVIVEEVLADRKRLEELSGGLVNGMSYPNGRFDDHVCDILRVCGILYSRTTVCENSFGLPQNWLKWHPTCHDRHATPELIKSFFDVRPWNRSSRLLYIWGHSYEFAREGGWEAIEATLANIRASGGDSVWAATNREIYDYAVALRSLMFAADATMVYNPAAIPVWIAANGEPLVVPAGTTIKL